MYNHQMETNAKDKALFSLWNNSLWGGQKKKTHLDISWDTKLACGCVQTDLRESL